MVAQSSTPGARDLTFDVQMEMEFRSVVFFEAGKPENTEKKPQSRESTNNKLTPRVARSTGIEPGSQRWEASAYPLRHPCSPNTIVLLIHCILVCKKSY